MSRFDHIQVAFSRLLAAIYYGESQWMLSSEAYRRKDSGVCGVIDTMF